MTDSQKPRWRLLSRLSSGMPRDSCGFGRSGDVSGNGESVYYEGTHYLPWSFIEDLEADIKHPDLYRDPNV